MNTRLLHDDHDDVAVDEMPVDPAQPEAGDVEVLDQLRSVPAVRPRPTLQRVSRELADRSDPDRVVPTVHVEWPWSARARVRAEARETALEARLEVFKDDLRAIRIANEVLNRAATMRAVEASEIAIFEIRTLGQTTRHSILNRAQLEMTRQFVAQLAGLEQFRGRLTDEVIDALKERALTEFTDRMNRVSKADLHFNHADILRLKA